MSQENLKKAIVAIVAVVAQATKSFADGVQASDFVPILLSGTPAAQVDWPAAISEAKDRTPENNQEILDFFKQEFNLPSATAETKIEACVSAVLAIDNVILAFKAVPETPEVITAA